MSANTSPATVTVEEVRHIADLSNLRLTPEEETAMQRDLNAILTYVAQLQELDTYAIPPMAQVSEMLPPLDGVDDDARVILRQDELRPSLDRERVTRSAPDTDGVFFKVPKVIER